MRWLRGKTGGLIAFLAIAGLVAGGLGWVTAAALRLEQEQLEARAEADFLAKLRQVLWQLDSLMMAKLSREASRPISHFNAISVPNNPVDATGNRCEPGDVVVVSPLVNEELPPWILLHFSTSPDVAPGEPRWWSPQRLSLDLRGRLTGITDVPPDLFEERAGLLGELEALKTEIMLAAVRWEERRQVAIRVRLVEDDVKPAPAVEDPAAAGDLANAGPYQGLNDRRRLLVYGQDPMSNSKTQNTISTTVIGRVSPNGEHWLRPWMSKQKKESREEVASIGPWNALWVTPEPERHPDRQRLIVARLVTVGNQQVCQGILLNWDALQKDLAAEVREVFPEARFQPIKQELGMALEAVAFPPHPERTMASLPVELDPGPPPALSDPGWTPLRIGLATAWAAALVALTAVALGGWSLIDLSQRRIRFVSTVTHELRTPLTTLRLYLDMLTGGMVREEKQKEEYLHTLNTETDRLSRLVGNVLDFSRLENQNPRLEKTTVKIADLLDDVYASWQTRCKDVEKELVIENSLPPEASLSTDVNLVRQILGNLIDNSCKYSRAAEDRRIWLRARADGSSISLEVEDRGPGVVRSERRSIFRPFRRGASADVIAGGVGLGLALSQRWAAMLGGTLSVEPGREHAGACFRLVLPG